MSGSVAAGAMVNRFGVELDCRERSRCNHGKESRFREKVKHDDLQRRMRGLGIKGPDLMVHRIVFL